MSDCDPLAEDPCRAEDTSSAPRAFAFVALFVIMFGSAVFVFLSTSTFDILFAGAIGYTACVMIYGFARNKSGIPPYLFTCPVVTNQYPRLLRRHAAFLTLLLACLIVALRIKPHPSEWMKESRQSDTIPFYFFIALPIAALALVEIMTNRAVLERAHNDRFGEPPTPAERDGTISIIARD